MSGMVLRNFDKILTFAFICGNCNGIYSYGLYFDGDKYLYQIYEQQIIVYRKWLYATISQTKFIQLDTSNLQIIKSDSLIQNILTDMLLIKFTVMTMIFSVGLFGAKYDYISKTFWESLTWVKPSDGKNGRYFVSIF